MSKPNSPNLDSVASLKSDGSRNFLRPADAKGKFTTARRISAFVLILIYVGLPWIPINGYPALFFDVIHLRFHLFGLTFAVQDFWLTFFLVSGLGFTLFMVTSLYGRIWCGWTCPHTVFLEHVYRRIERLIEGPVADQKRLDKLPWSDNEKLMKRGFKQALFVLVSVLISHVFISYFISIPELYQWMTHNPTAHWSGFLFVIIMSGLLYFNFAWFREQLCLAICPYGRLQSALIDDDSIVIGYDEIRGEPRGKPREQGVGDCIDCKRCVNVCPTGIDIRQGLQMECVGCSNCIDACNAVMSKLGRPSGLIRYDSLNGFDGKGHHIIRPRLFLYLFFLLAGIGVMSYAFSNVKSAYMMITRMVGSPYYQTETNVRNQYNVRIINKTDAPQSFSLQVESELPDLHKFGFEEPVNVAPMKEIILPLVVTVDLEDFKEPFKFDVIVERLDGKIQLKRNVHFLGPDIKNLDIEMVFER